MRERRQLLQRARALGGAGRPAVVATVVAVDGSSYRREGARLLLEPDGALTGVVSGGCLERDLVRQTAGVLAKGVPRLVLYDLLAEEEAIWGFGLGCAGRLTLLLEPLAGDGLRALEAALAPTLDRRQHVHSILLIDSEAVSGTAHLSPNSTLSPAISVRRWSATLQPGESAAFLAAGAELGSTPPPWIVAELARLGAGEARALRREIDGTVELLLIESLLPPIHLLVAGAGRDVAPLARFAAELGWELTLLPPRVPLGAEVERSPRTAAVIASHSYLDDLARLEQLAGAPLGYLSVLGPRRRTDRLIADLARRGVAIGASPATPVRGPAGLALGGRTPEEVALAIVAEIQAVMHHGSGRSLSAHDRPPVEETSSTESGSDSGAELGTESDPQPGA